MLSVILLACVAACPLVMGGMMLMMMRGRRGADRGKHGGD